jgi:predicted acylesterase/phospholipase RssA
MRRPSLLRGVGSIFIRLPLAFLLPFLALSGTWTFWAFRELDRYLKLTGNSLFESVPILFFGIALVALYVCGLIIAYNVSVFLGWGGVLLHSRLRSLHVAPAQPYRPDPPSAETLQHQLSGVQKIGIVLAGGGAKGAFQAGAMKAIYRFLAENNALDKVKVISGTSIGAWNALFWLADLIESKEGPDKPSAHETWWRSIRLRSLVSPSWYVPGLRNSFLGTEPWQLDFDRLFGQAAVKQHLAATNLHFYLTRSRVLSGHLECATNNPRAKDIPKVTFKHLDASKGVDHFVQAVKFSVFASMDLPPLFPYMAMGKEYFEDGGVVDNLPILFATMEECDLVFVLPLNSDFNALPNHRSILNRFLRVMDVRQGALERASLKTHYLYNELAVLRKRVEVLEAEMCKADIPLPPSPESETLKFALRRTHGLSKIFAVCPLRTVVEETIDTHELWKARQAGEAFELMHEATARALAKFDPSQERIRVAQIDFDGGHSWHEDF